MNSVAALKVLGGSTEGTGGYQCLAVTLLCPDCYCSPCKNVFQLHINIINFLTLKFRIEIDKQSRKRPINIDSNDLGLKQFKPKQSRPNHE